VIMIWAFIGVLVGFACGYPHGYLSAEIDQARRARNTSGVSE